jgi:hypothetical protein
MPYEAASVIASPYLSRSPLVSPASGGPRSQRPTSATKCAPPTQVPGVRQAARAVSQGSLEMAM